MWALDAYEQMQPGIADAPVTQLNYPELFTLIDRVCPHWVHVSRNMRLDHHIPWHKLASGGWAAERMSYIEGRLNQLGLSQFDRRSQS